MVDIRNLNLTNMTVNALRSNGIRTLEDLKNTSEVALMRIPNIGRKSIKSIRDAIIDSDKTPYHVRAEQSSETQFGQTPTLRDQFAMAALTGLVARHSNDIYCDVMAEWAYDFADAMLAEREQ